MTDQDDIIPFRIDVPDATLLALRDRLATTDWPAALSEPAGSDWSYGPTVEYLAPLVERWRTDHDWRAAEAALNRIPQYTTVVDGQTIHFGHIRSPEPGAVPLLLTHGWPSAFSDYASMVGPLTDPVAHGGGAADAFHLVVPSLPGFGFSTPLADTGWGVRRTAAAWAELMSRLGYRRFGVHGGDFGAKVSPQVARHAPDRVLGVHVHALTTTPSQDPLVLATLKPSEQDRLAGLRRWHRDLSGYAMVHSTRPRAVGYALADSPVGQLAWYVDWFAAHGEQPDGVSVDDMLTTTTLYWVTGTAASAIRFYRESAGDWGPAPVSGVPTAVAVFPGDTSIRPFAEQEHHVTRWTEFDTGGHFAALQTPGLLVADLRAFFRDLR